MCLKIYQFDPPKFISPPRLAWQAALIKSNVKLDLLTDINMLLMTAKGIRARICHSIYRYTKANNKQQNYFGDANNLYDQAMLQRLAVNNFEWIKTLLNLMTIS